MMNRGLTRTSWRRTSWSFRTFVAFTSLVGIIAMHGLTMNHNTTMASHGTQTPETTAHGSSHGAMVMQKPAIPPTAPEELTFRVSKVTASTVATPSVTTEHGMGGMATACLAFLSALLFAGAALSLVQTVRRTKSSLRVGGFRTTSAVEYRLKPDLALLSVMRN